MTFRQRPRVRSPLDHSVLGYADSYSRLPRAIEIIAMERFSLASFQLLGECWSCSDNIAAYRGDLEILFSECRWGAGKVRKRMDVMMDLAAWRQYRKLPTTLTVYRGCYANNKDGLSWSLDRDVAVRFPYLHRYRQAGQQPLLVTGTVERDTGFLITDRDEAEFVSLAVRATKVEELPKPTALDPAVAVVADGFALG